MLINKPGYKWGTLGWVHKVYWYLRCWGYWLNAISLADNAVPLVVGAVHWSTVC